MSSLIRIAITHIFESVVTVVMLTSCGKLVFELPPIIKTTVFVNIGMADVICMPRKLFLVDVGIMVAIVDISAILHVAINTNTNLLLKFKTYPCYSRYFQIPKN